MYNKSMKKKMTLRQKNFVNNLTKGYNQKQSAVLAGYSRDNASVIASQLVHNESIIKALKDKGITDEYLSDNIKYHIEAGKGIKETADTSLKAIELVTKLNGYTDSSKEDNNTSNIYIRELKVMDNNSLNDKLDLLLKDIDNLKNN